MSKKEIYLYTSFSVPSFLKDKKQEKRKEQGIYVMMESVGKKLYEQYLDDIKEKLKEVYCQTPHRDHAIGFKIEIIDPDECKKLMEEI